MEIGSDITKTRTFYYDLSKLTKIWPNVYFTVIPPKDGSQSQRDSKRVTQDSYL